MKTMISMLVLVAVMGLAGCSTYSEMATRQVSYSGTTNKTPQAYADCALPKMIDFNAAAHIVDYGAARVIVVPVGGGTPNAVMLTLRAAPDGSVTHVELRHMASLSAFGKQWHQAQTCL